MYDDDDEYTDDQILSSLQLENLRNKTVSEIIDVLESNSHNIESVIMTAETKNGNLIYRRFGSVAQALGLVELTKSTYIDVYKRDN